eukprot:Plantae.Rhodophyta-Hildenbrandia_rubra.ctg19066.p1 GENE.Plantae.Rhodophyta-Hildenbrandia_rubra.ctg19066~~Plantae.Rhodophyta-Hildenbrandia_rubra.ctg19066.p1  ORF type:complete len:346 (-),score=61.94 Plantae.Rhodophyta-Hildenbrandia_rubra.ctg19066:2109-3146(-)
MQVCFAALSLPLCDFKTNTSFLCSSWRTNKECCRKEFVSSRSDWQSMSVSDDKPQTASKPADAAKRNLSPAQKNEKSTNNGIPQRSRTNTTQKYSLRARLREEIQNPLRKVRMFIFGGFAASASVGALISGLRIIAYLFNVAGTQPISETLPNFGINVTVVGTCAYLLREEVRRGDKNLGRISRGAQLAALRIRLSVTGAIVSLGALRGKRRVVIVVGNEDGVSECVENAKKVSKGLEESSVVVVPYIKRAKREIVDRSGLVLRTGPWIAEPVGDKEWSKWLESEESAVKRKSNRKGAADSRKQVRVLIVRMDGKVGARSLGPPMWQKLVDEIKKLPTNDRYGAP